MAVVAVNVAGVAVLSLASSSVALTTRTRRRTSAGAHTTEPS